MSLYFRSLAGSVQPVKGANAEGHVALTLGVTGEVPFEGPGLERVVVAGDFAVRPRGVGCGIPGLAAGRLNLDALHDAELLLVGDLIQCVFAGTAASGDAVPCGSRQGDRGGKRRAVELVDHNAWPQIVKVDDVVNSAGQGEREGLLALAEFVGLNRVEGLLTAVGTVLVGRVDLRVAVVVVPVGTGVLVNGLNFWRSRNVNRRVADDVVPVAVDEEIAGQRDKVGEAEGIGFQFVEGQAHRIADDHGGVGHVRTCCLDLVPDQFTLSNLRAPLGVLVLNEDLRRVEVLEVGVREHGGVGHQLDGQGHVAWGQFSRHGQLQHSSVT